MGKPAWVRTAIVATLGILTCGHARPATAQSAVPQSVGEWDSYGRSAGKITCGSRPVLLTGNHSDVSLTGPCRYVRVAGAHNDVELTLVPGGTVEITGAHNDVFWHPLGDPSVRPVLLDRGTSNTFHRRTGGE